MSSPYVSSIRSDCVELPIPLVCLCDLVRSGTKIECHC